MLGLVALAGVLTGEPAIFAQQGDVAPADAAAAEVLFQTGKRLLEQRQLAEACPKLAESFRLDPATGTLLALAMCHEAEGKIATAWAEYGDVADRAKREGRPDRQEAARQWKAVLEPKLSLLTIVVPEVVAALPGLVVARDGVTLGRPSWFTPVPVDPGRHVIAVTAPRKQRWQEVIDVDAEGERLVVTVGSLEDAPREAAQGGMVLVSRKPDAAPEPGPPFYRRWWVWTGLGLAAAGSFAVAAASGAFTSFRDAVCPEGRMCGGP